jgi:transcription elongation GreA/GreB family factor
MNDIQKAKLEMWTKKKAETEQAIKDAMKRKGEAAQMGDLSENAAYKMAIEDIEMGYARMNEIDKILENIKNPVVKP